MEPRMASPASLVPQAMDALVSLMKVTAGGSVEEQTLALSHLRASQINGCSPCVAGGAQHLRKAGASDERIFAVAAWRETPYFTPAERAALALTESVTRLSDRSDPVPDAVWDEAAQYYDQQQLAILILSIATTNAFNRLNATTRQQAGAQW